MVHFYAIKNAFDGQTHLDKEVNMSVHGIEKSGAWARAWSDGCKGRDQAWFLHFLCSASLPQCCRSVGHKSHFSPLWLFGVQPLPWLWVSSSGSVGKPRGTSLHASTLDREGSLLMNLGLSHILHLNEAY